MDKERIMRLQNLDVLSKPQGKQITAPQVMEFLKMTWEALLEEDVGTPPTPRSSPSAPMTWMNKWQFDEHRMTAHGALLDEASCRCDWCKIYRDTRDEDSKPVSRIRSEGAEVKAGE